ncbi:SigE family RNA polymerase sigma factor [Streptosporangiaceae bacterium NEAU-GS5]|nr:SigE family RNA polymerase sigma factor [Streptosporangiaceae bacterium NEAU-GS5]
MDRYDSFREFVTAHQQSLMRTSYLLTGDAHLAEDLLQSVLLKIVGRWQRVLRTERPEAYTRKALLHEYVSWRRRLSSRELPSADLPDLGPPGWPGSGEDATVVRVMVREALMRLPPRQRAVIVLRFFEDRTERETAELLGCSIGTVKSQGHHALTRLRALAPHLAPRFPDPDFSPEQEARR